jgi:hypothetical protein
MIDPASIDLHTFLSDWYGTPNVPPSTLPVECDWLPDPLKYWYRLSARWNSPIMKLKRMSAPEQITHSDGKSVFMKDSTGDWLWAFDVEDKSTVYDAELHAQWERTAERLSEFLVHNALNETVYGASNWREGTQVNVGLLPDILAPMTEISFHGWRWPRPGGSIFKSAALLAEVGPAMKPNSPWEDRQGYVEVRVAAVDSADLAYLDEMESIKWLGSL